MSRQLRSITATLKQSEEWDPERLKFRMDEKNAFIIYALVENLEAPYTGKYLFKMKLPKTYPNGAPAIEALTPNGVYTPGGNFCVSIGSFHDNNYIPTLKFSGFMKMVMQGMIDGINGGVLIEPHQSAEKSAQFAAESHEYNLQKNAAVYALFGYQ